MNDDKKKLVDKINMLTGMLSNVKKARKQSNSALNYRPGNSNFSSVPHGRTPLSHSTFGVSRNPSVPYNKSFSFHKNSVTGPNNSQKFVNAQSVQNSFENARHQAHNNYKFCKANINTRYTKTNVIKPLSEKAVGMFSSSNLTIVTKVNDASSSKYAQPCNVENTDTKGIVNSKCIQPPLSNLKNAYVKDSEIIKCDVQLLNGDVSSQYCSPVKTVPDDDDEDPCDIICEIFTKTDNSNRDTCTVHPTSETVQEIEVLFDSKVPDNHEVCKPAASAAAASASSLKDITSEKIERISRALSEISRRNTLKDDSSVDKLQQKSSSSASKNFEQIWKSKYKVINRHVKSSLEEKTKETKCIQRSGLLENTDPNQIASNSSSLNNKYKLVKTSGENKSSTEQRISKNKMLLLNPAINNNAATDGTNKSNSIKYSPYKSPSKKLSSLINPKSSFASQSSSSRNDSAAKLDMKLKELERQTRSHYQGYDLSQISPMELVSLDHKSLLKIVANEKKPESFVKKSKYKLESKSTNEKQWNKLKTIPSVRAGTKLRTVQKPIDQTGSHKTRVVMIRGMKYQVGSSGRCMKAVLKRSSGTDKSFTKTPLKRLYQNRVSAFSTNTPQQARNVASRVLNRSIRSVRKASNKKTSPKSDAYCIFFNRFGRCNTGDSCPYIHDPNKIAVCTRFLKGSCKRKGCPFSHEINPGKMAICSFYLRGACKKDNLCPYRHELLKPGTELCKAFVRGYCPNGSECEKAHILSCPDYMRGCCKKEDCQYPHPPRKVKRKIEDSFASLKRAKIEPSKEEPEVKQVEDNIQESDFRYFSHDPNTGEIKIFCDENNDGTILPKRLSDISGLADFIPLRSKTQYRPEEFSDAECLE